MYTANEIRQKLLTDDRWLYRACVAIYRRQTADEQGSYSTKHDNGVGFNGCDAAYCSWAANEILKWHQGDSNYAAPLGQAKRDKLRRRMLKYAGQLAQIANERVTPAQLAWQRAQTTTVA